MRCDTVSSFSWQSRHLLLALTPWILVFITLVRSACSHAAKIKPSVSFLRVSSFSHAHVELWSYFPSIFLRCCPWSGLFFQPINLFTIVVSYTEPLFLFSKYSAFSLSCYVWWLVFKNVSMRFFGILLSTNMETPPQSPFCNIAMLSLFLMFVSHLSQRWTTSFTTRAECNDAVSKLTLIHIWRCRRRLRCRSRWSPYH